MYARTARVPFWSTSVRQRVGFLSPNFVPVRVGVSQCHPSWGIHFLGEHPLGAKFKETGKHWPHTQHIHIYFLRHCLELSGIHSLKKVEAFGPWPPSLEPRLDLGHEMGRICHMSTSVTTQSVYPPHGQLVSQISWNP